MKYKSFATYSLLSVFLFLGSCSDDDNFSTDRKFGGTLTATVSNGDVFVLPANNIYIAQGIFEMTSNSRKGDFYTGPYGNIFRFTTALGIDKAEYSLASGENTWNDALGGALMSMTYRLNEEVFYTSTINSDGSFIIKEIDEINRTMSGTFSGTLFNAEIEEEVTVTDGVFSDVPYTILEYRQYRKGTKKMALLNGESLKMLNTGVWWESDYFEFTYNNPTQHLFFRLPKNLPAGTYSVAELLEADAWIRFTDGIYNYGVASGTMIVTTHNSSTGEFGATFDFDFELAPSGGRTIRITEGVVSADYGN